MKVRIDGAAVHSEGDVHRQLAAQLEFGEQYGWNIAALRDRLLRDVPRPVEVVWDDHGLSRDRLGPAFDRFEQVLVEAEQQDAAFGWKDRFTFRLD